VDEVVELVYQDQDVHQNGVSLRGSGIFGA
jgi:hypothetical protein